MTRPVHEVLRDILRRHGTALIEDRKRCENCLREAPLARPEINGLVAALDEAIPHRMARQPAGTLAPSGIAALAAELARNSGLAEPVARRSVEAWAWALGTATPPADGATDASGGNRPGAAAVQPGEADRLTAKDAPPRRAVDPPVGESGAIPWRAAALVAAGAGAGLVTSAVYFIILGALIAPSLDRVWRDILPASIGIGLPIGALAGLLAARRIARRTARAEPIAGGVTASALVLIGLWLGREMVAPLILAPKAWILLLPLVAAAVGAVQWVSRGRRRVTPEAPPAAR